MNPAKAPTRQLILHSAYSLIVEEGVGQLTLHAVADRANISKGGLLYHFPNKNALIIGLIEDLFGRFNHRMLNDIKENGEHSGRWAHAYIRTTFHSEENEDQELQISVGLLAALVNSPKLLQPAQNFYQEWQKNMEEDGIDPAIATICRLASDGLWFTDMFGLAPLTDKDLRERVLNILLQLSKGELR